QQFERPFEIEIGQVLGDRGALGLGALAHLHIGPEAARLAHHFEAGDRVLAHRTFLARAVALARLAEAAAVLAFGIIDAADESAEAPALERQPAPAAAFLDAFRTLARIAA